MNRKVSLTDLLGRQGAGDDAAKSPVEENAVSAPRDWPAMVAPVSEESSRETPKVAPGKAASQRYDELVRKETRIRPDQYAALTRTQRALNKARGSEGERITENTLIRVAIDMFLASEGAIAGTTEAEIRESVGL
ncbi:hypothetical protein [Sanguibacter suarezii]|uniref:hypothetical protein n=1 Tax=Sanguibacter suarezii TaxID=60921 RepID=UPI000834BD58|nr:hypothetical protein [Sanguibacter suarezii]